MFWRKGLDAASVRDLAGDMGIAAPSLYNAFGHKRGLYAAALERYVETRMRKNIAEIEARFPAPHRVHAFFEALVSRSCSDAGKLGCLMINAAIDAAPHEPDIAHAVNGYLGELEAFFTRSIGEAQATGAIRDDLDVPGTARLLLATLIGIRVAGRANNDRAFLEGMAAPALALVETAANERARARSPSRAETSRQPQAARRQVKRFPATIRRRGATRNPTETA